MRKHIIYRYFLFLSLVGLMQLTFSCSSSSNEIEPLKPEGEDTPLEKDEYTFMNVEYRKWQNGTFQAWTTADSRETRTIDNMIGILPLRVIAGLHGEDESVCNLHLWLEKKAFSEWLIVEAVLICSIRIMELLSFMEFSMFVRENLLLIRRLSVLDTVVRRNGVKRLANC